MEHSLGKIVGIVGIYVLRAFRYVQISTWGTKVLIREAFGD